MGLNLIYHENLRINFKMKKTNLNNITHHLDFIQQSINSITKNINNIKTHLFFIKDYLKPDVEFVLEEIKIELN